MNRFRLLAGAALVAVASTTTTGQRLLDYPQWRGHDRDGAASGFAEPASWPAYLTRRWRVDVGQGYATPLVIRDTVYVFTHRAGREGITALDTATGRERWRTEYPVIYEPYEGAEDHGYGPRATPVFQDGRLFTLGVSGTISAFDAERGNLFWQKPAPSVQPYVGTASSPIADQDLVIFQADGDTALTAFETETGAVRWSVRNDFRYSSPIIVEIAGERQLIALAQEAVLGISLADGSVLWQHPWKSPYVQAITPVRYRDTIIVSGHHRGVMALRPVQKAAGWSAEVVWETRDVSLYLSNPVIIGDTLFGLSHWNSGQFFALDAPTGRILWRDRPRRALNSAIAKAGTLLFFLTDEAELLIARSNRRRLEPLKTYSVAESATWAQPAISGGRFFVKDVSSLTLWTLD